MAFKWYHGKTGVVWNVTKRALGVEVYKKVSSKASASACLCVEAFSSSSSVGSMIR
jgi:ribosomal protein L21E